MVQRSPLSPGRPAHVVDVDRPEEEPDVRHVRRVGDDLISCVDAELNSDRDRVPALLVAQVTHRVRWEESVRKAIHIGCERGIELGNGTVLRNLNRRIDKRFSMFNLGEPKDLDSLPKE